MPRPNRHAPMPAYRAPPALAVRTRAPSSDRSQLQTQQQKIGFFPFSREDYVLRNAPARHAPQVNLRLQHERPFFIGPRPSTRLQVNQLAFSEGFANFFSMMVQQEQGVSAPAVPGAGDQQYRGFTVEVGLNPNGLFSQQGASGLSSGEDEELTVMRILWDLYDRAGSADLLHGRQLDRVELGFADLFELIRDNKVLTLDQLWDVLEKEAGLNTPQFDLQKLLDFAGVFELNNVSPRPLGIEINGVFASSTPRLSLPTTRGGSLPTQP